MVDYRCIRGAPDDVLRASLSGLCTHVFGDDGPFDFGDADWVLKNMPDVSVQVAVSDEELVGFKIGYAETPGRYYSYLGGVHSARRRCGIARQLATNQHAWVAARGYKGIETGAINSNTPMIALNLSMGFRVIGSYCRSDLPRIRMFKDL